MKLLRTTFARRGISSTEMLKTSKNGDVLTLAGLVLVRQRPGTASGVVFVTLEDEFGIANLVVWPKVFDAHRRIVMGSRLMGVRGRVSSAEGEKEYKVIHLVAEEVWDLSVELDSISELDLFHLTNGRGDEVRTDPGDRRMKVAKPMPPATAQARACPPNLTTTALASSSTGPKFASIVVTSTDSGAPGLLAHALDLPRHSGLRDARRRAGTGRLPPLRSGDARSLDRLPDLKLAAYGYTCRMINIDTTLSQAMREGVQANERTTWTETYRRTLERVREASAVNRRWAGAEATRNLAVLTRLEVKYRRLAEP